MSGADGDGPDSILYLSWWPTSDHRAVGILQKLWWKFRDFPAVPNVREQTYDDETYVSRRSTSDRPTVGVPQKHLWKFRDVPARRIGFPGLVFFSFFVFEKVVGVSENAWFSDSRHLKVVFFLPGLVFFFLFSIFVFPPKVVGVL